LAKDTVVGREVAIKTLRAEQLAPRQREHWLRTFRREAAAIAPLNHPHILTLHDFGVDEGVPYLVLEYLKGRTLDTLLQQGPLDLSRVIDLSTQLADALDHAHRHAVIHRDLKPANIFIQPGDRLKVMDFGIALLNTDRRALAARLGRDAQALDAYLGSSPMNAGTPLMMAPEQLVGHDEQDGRTDLWALGVVIFTMITGSLPFAHPLHILSEDAPSPATFRADVPEALCEIVARCLERYPDCLLYTSPSPRDRTRPRMPSSA